jgi:eukaryotic-like serine/threonine-protein kinase
MSRYFDAKQGTYVSRRIPKSPRLTREIRVGCLASDASPTSQLGLNSDSTGTQLGFDWDSTRIRLGLNSDSTGTQLGFDWEFEERVLEALKGPLPGQNGGCRVLNCGAPTKRAYWILVLEPGDSVTPSIRLIRPLGQGGMGSVWVAEHSGLKCEVVIKFILEEVKNREDVRARFEREASLLAMAKSPHVVQIYDHGISLAGLPYIAMEHLVGEDLDTRLRREGRIEPRLFAGWFRQACSGLARAHSKGIVHRDLKPANLFLVHEDDGVIIKILDFGIAKSSSREDMFATTAGALLGTAFYMSPEQARGRRDVDLRSDIWSMGVLAYHALTGQLPFNGDSIANLAIAIVESDFRRPSEILPSLPPALDAWMERALAKDPERRFPSARTLGDELGVVLDDVSAPASRSSYPASTPVPREGRGGTTLSPAVTGSQHLSAPDFWNTRPLPQRAALGMVGLLGVGLAVFGAFTLVSRSREADVPAAEGRPMSAASPAPTEPPRSAELPEVPPAKAATSPRQSEPQEKEAKAVHKAGARAPRAGSSPRIPGGAPEVPARPSSDESAEPARTPSKAEKSLDMPLH